MSTNMRSPLTHSIRSGRLLSSAISLAPIWSSAGTSFAGYSSNAAEGSSSSPMRERPQGLSDFVARTTRAAASLIVHALKGSRAAATLHGHAAAQGQRSAQESARRLVGCGSAAKELVGD
eukprot:CAMPEP_0204514192 /NCGR_PEP_ID=MMETSP0661-20131031/1932_1 /ASSEMBLY_ACC=CAM_ASM_000606 /TAXON_ID=109239 /ORGANISM="Alexandrium margalefi, Strain AMGDE01CS-322" /LENGTH=119 /DNA_ID=CAMNT_0051519427 /DNA_START=16 /DNA_END=376 /DNA_ORIENTATION=+